MKDNSVKGRILFFIVMAMTLVLSACSSASSPSSGNGANDFYSKGRPVTLIAPAAPGSGWDVTARALNTTLEKERLIDFPLQVVNEPGATGAVSLSQLATQDKGDAYSVSITSTPIMSNYLRGDSKYSYKDVTMIARLVTEYYMVVVPKDSPYKSLKDLIDAVKKNPKSVSIGASGDDRLPFALLVNEEGGNPQKINYITYEGGGEISNALLNGDLDAAVSGVSEFRGQVEAGNFRGLAVTSGKRLGGVVKDVPTASEAGVDVTFGNWRGLMGPPDMPKEAVTYWQDTIDKALKTDTWKDFVKKNQWETTFMKGEEFQQYLNESNSDIKTGLQKTGEIK
ncbi:C4-dicarboxylate ABC transporter substrate-binding protein [Marinithermofilum abyssi]|uniref:C4-dicarboxylate ABC transporter substrate-binding protein n=1 Tax=Marinithermofilum abyssi TaxID=1571185 RepID=A0A8J2VMB9_9BACL|nr:tripartite tricarboxylate transporter substrate binding protein [Marinithermofilum abyssi]GGE28523.1 C4-dicarboxylate ABC transporter substrate-binding protein [Marinithermofilum abyssi]